ncbi:hypothetical protein V1477_009927 [Vespula maculifrons]|uniref:Uncharacterized protein n=1 Tax=Vespula maculifrons TaxID=7453 RepID=A0ABD2CB57_VESMC
MIKFPVPYRIYPPRPNNSVRALSREKDSPYAMVGGVGPDRRVTIGIYTMVAMVDSPMVSVDVVVMVVVVIVVAVAVAVVAVVVVVVVVAVVVVVVVTVVVVVE